MNPSFCHCVHPSAAAAIFGMRLHDLHMQLKLWEPCGDISNYSSTSVSVSLDCCPPGSSCSHVEPSSWICQPVAAVKRRSLLVSNSTSTGEDASQSSNASATAVNGDFHGSHSTADAPGNGTVLFKSGNATAEAEAAEALNSTDVEMVTCNQAGVCMSTLSSLPAPSSGDCCM